MANPEHLAILRRGVEEWNAWRKKHEEVRPDLDHADLSNVDLSNVNLSSANLAGANLTEANLDGADLNGAALDQATLLQANLARATLRGATLLSADLRKAILHRADLTQANLRLAILEQANLSNAILCEADLGGARLHAAKLSQANLYKTRFVDADLTETKWWKSSIDRGTNFTHSRFGPGHSVMSDYSDTVEVAVPDWAPTWSRVRGIGRFPVFGVSWAALGASLALINFIGFVNENPGAREWLAFEIPFPLRSQLIVFSSLLLVAGSTLYRVGCPARVQEFSETEWVEAHGHPRLLYISDSLGRSWIV